MRGKTRARQARAERCDRRSRQRAFSRERRLILIDFEISASEKWLFLLLLPFFFFSLAELEIKYFEGFFFSLKIERGNS